MRFGILLCFVLCGCFTHTRSLTKEVKTNFTNRLEGGNTGLSKKININGIYRYWHNNDIGIPEKIYNTKDTFFLDMIFYDDGTFIWNLWPDHKFTNYEQYFRSVISKGKKDLFYEADWWGVYSMAGDTIKTQYIMHASPWTPWYTGQNWFVIKGPSTLQLIYQGEIEDKEPILLDPYVQRTSLAHFIPQKEIPPSYGWIKDERFFWRYEIDWQQYQISTGSPPHHK